MTAWYPLHGHHAAVTMAAHLCLSFKALYAWKQNNTLMAIHQQELDYIATEPHQHGEESLVILSCLQIKDITLHHLQESVIFFLAKATFLCQPAIIQYIQYVSLEFMNSEMLVSWLQVMPMSYKTSAHHLSSLTTAGAELTSIPPAAEFEAQCMTPLQHTASPQALICSWTHRQHSTGSILHTAAPVLEERWKANSPYVPADHKQKQILLRSELCPEAIISLANIPLEVALVRAIPTTGLQVKSLYPALMAREDANIRKGDKVRSVSQPSSLRDGWRPNTALFVLCCTAISGWTRIYRSVNKHIH